MNGTPILLIDDDPDIRDCVQEVLAREGMDVRCAANGPEALALLKTDYLPSVILLDLMMPLMSGDQFVEAYRRDCEADGREPAPMIILSAGNGVRQFSDRLGISFLEKPVDLDRLVETVTQNARDA